MTLVNMDTGQSSLQNTPGLFSPNNKTFFLESDGDWVETNQEIKCTKFTRQKSAILQATSKMR